MSWSRVGATVVHLEHMCQGVRMAFLILWSTLSQHSTDICPEARLAQSAERKALNLVVVGSSPTVGVAIAGVGIRGPCAPCYVQSALCIPRGGFWSGDPAVFSISAGMTFCFFLERNKQIFL